MKTVKDKLLLYPQETESENKQWEFKKEFKTSIQGICSKTKSFM